MQYSYQCIRFKQTTSNKWLVQFAARAAEIDVWAGVPQKRRFEFGGEMAGETVGFQRQEDSKRVEKLCEFYENPENIIQNPLLCSLREIPGSSINFDPAPDTLASSSVQVGRLVIEVPEFSQFSIEDCIRQVREYLERRVPSLKENTVNPDILQELRSSAAQLGYPQEQKSPEESGEDEEDESLESSQNGDPTGVLFEESHIIEFWQEVAARDEVIKEIDRAIEDDKFLGFTKEALLSYLRPAVLVDGQHRLRGALAAAQQKLNDPTIQSEVDDRIEDGESSDAIESEILLRESRLLPISLLMSPDPEEQVFQFVVVNQKATPIARALLGTIVSTTLSPDELDNVANRLKNAGIEVEESQSITYLALHHDSPFCNLVERGLTGDSSTLLQWNVFASLIRIFRTLTGGRLYGEPNDYAKLWGKKYLSDSLIVANYKSHECESPMEYWSKRDGPWRRVFIVFWTKIRDVFGNTDDPDKPNYWGRPRDSNLFNKVSLTILAADFFQSLYETKYRLRSEDEIPKLVDDWLENVNAGYFDKNWEIKGVKKDSTGIRSQWASMWSNYRKAGGNLPDKRNFRKAKN